MFEPGLDPFRFAVRSPQHLSCRVTLDLWKRSSREIGRVLLQPLYPPVPPAHEACATRIFSLNPKPSNAPALVPTGVPRLHKNAPPPDPAVSLSLGPYDGPRKVGVSL